MLDFYELQTDEHTQIAEFYENLDDDRLTTTQCTDCGEIHFPPRIVCPECTSDDLEYVNLPHEGELFAFSEVRGGLPLGLSEHDVPYVVAAVDLGPVMLSARIDDAAYDDLEIGDPVSLKIVEIDGPTDHERVFYRFEPKEESSA
nr:Zn-ribbon domain-containing OB-fold protein [Halostagnicola sp. A56]